MAASRPLLLAFLLASVISAPLVASQSFDPFPGLTCPAPGYIVSALVAGLYQGYFCTTDPCAGTPSTPSPCGPGNTCTVREANQGGGITFYIAECECNAPYVAAQWTYTVNVKPTACYIPGQDPCSPNPCQNNGTCNAAKDANGTPIFPICSCPRYGPYYGPFCQFKSTGSNVWPVATVNGITGPIAQAIPSAYVDQFCGPATPIGCESQDQKSYVCCTVGCGPFGPDQNTPLCRGDTFVPTPNAYNPPSTYPSGPNNQGDCGYGFATKFPVRCFFNNESPQGRYLCCDTQGCNGFASDNSTPVCKNGNGYTTPGYGVLGLLPPTYANTLVPASTDCPSVNGVPTNSCFSSDGNTHVCCIDPDSCGERTSDGNPTCANGQYYSFH